MCIRDSSPSGQNYGEADKQVKALAAELWDGLDGNRKKLACIGKGLLMVNMEDVYKRQDQSTQRVFYNVFDVKGNLKMQNNAIGIILGNGWYNQRDRTVEGHMWYDVPKMCIRDRL